MALPQVHVSIYMHNNGYIFCLLYNHAMHESMVEMGQHSDTSQYAIDTAK